MTKQKIKDGVPVVEYGSPQHLTMLEVGYGMSADDARLVIKEREQNPALHSHEDVKRAKAMLAAISPTNLNPSSSRPGWKRQRTMGR